MEELVKYRWGSHCCNANTKVVGNTTKYYQCKECGQPCQPVKQIINNQS